MAALEAALTLREHAPAHVNVTLVAPGQDYVDRASSVHQPFSRREAEHLPLAVLARDMGANLVSGALERVVPDERQIVLRDGRRLGYDELIVATGAPRAPAYEHALTFRGSRDAEAMHGLVEDIEDGYVDSVAFVVPPRVAWSLPLYELALMTARRAYDTQAPTRFLLITPEPAPFALFGSEASRHVSGLLEAAGVEVRAATTAEVPSCGMLVLHPGGKVLACERVVALPTVAGPAIPGLPSDVDGFVPVDAHGAVRGTPHVHAVGDATNFPIKQGGLACQQADAAGRSVAAAAGADIEPQPFRPVLRAQLRTGGVPYFMRADLSGRTGDPVESGSQTLWWPPAKIAGRRLAPFLAAHRRRQAEGIRRRFVMTPADGEGTERTVMSLDSLRPL